MEASVVPVRRRPGRDLVPAVAGLLGFLAIAAALLWWAKWSPYTHKLSHLLSTRAWSGKDLLTKAGAPGSAPSLARAWTFSRAYATDVWAGFLAALGIAAAVQALLPRRWLLRVLARRGRRGGSLAGGILSLPSLMCTCCTAPIAATLRRDGAPTSGALAYWIGNPTLNPAVLAFLAIVAPWQWVAVRIVVGCVLVFGATALVARLTEREPPAELELPPVPSFDLRAAPRNFVRAFLGLAIRLVPVYVVMVLVLGLFRGWVFPLDAGAAHWVVLSVFAAAILGTLIVLPTAGEIPILQGLAGAGVSAATLGTLLITLPAISLVSMAMVVRAFSPRVTAAMAGAVAGCGLLAGGLLWLLMG